MHAKTLCSLAIGINLLWLPTNALLARPSGLIETDPASGNFDSCPTQGMELEPYLSLYNQLNNNYAPLNIALENFITTFVNNGGDPSNPAVEAAYTALGIEARTVANCTDPSAFYAWNIPNDCQYQIVVALPVGDIIFDSIYGDCNSAESFTNGLFNYNLNNDPTAISAQQNFCGNQWATEFNYNDEIFEDRVAMRFGNEFNNNGTIALIQPAIIK